MKAKMFMIMLVLLAVLAQGVVGATVISSLDDLAGESWTNVWGDPIGPVQDTTNQIEGTGCAYYAFPADPATLGAWNIRMRSTALSAGTIDMSGANAAISVWVKGSDTNRNAGSGAAGTTRFTQMTLGDSSGNWAWKNVKYSETPGEWTEVIVSIAGFNPWGGPMDYTNITGVDLAGSCYLDTAPQVTDLYVDDVTLIDGTTNPLQALIDATAADGTLTISDSGTYYGVTDVTIDKNITIQSVPAGARILGDIVISGTPTVTIDGFFIAGSTVGHTIDIPGAADVTISNCSIKGNSPADLDAAGGYLNSGGAIVATSGATLTVTDCDIELESDGDAATHDTHCGIYAGPGVALTAHRNVMYGQELVWGGSMADYWYLRGNIILEDNASADIANCLLLDGDGASMRMVGNANAVIDHCTIVDAHSRTAAIWVQNAGGETMNLTLTNSIIEGKWWIGVHSSAAGTVNFTDDYNVINLTRNPLYYNGLGTPAGTNTLLSAAAGYVKFTNQSNTEGRENRGINDYHLLTGSPAIDSADAASTIAVDVEGSARPYNGVNDRGCYEYAYIPVVNPLQAIIDAATAGDTITLADTDVYFGDFGVTIDKNLTIVSVPAGAEINDSIAIATGATVTLTDLVINPDKVANGVTLAADSVATITNCIIKNAKLPGMLANDSTLNNGCGIFAGAGADLTVADCLLTDNNYNGISAVGADLVSVSRTEFAGGVNGTDALGGWSNSWANGPRYSAYIAIEDVASADITNCLLTGLCQVGVRILGATTATLDHNTLDGTTSYGGGFGTYGIGIDATASTNFTATNNIVHKYAHYIYATAAGVGTVQGDYNFFGVTSWGQNSNYTPGTNDVYGGDPLFVGGGDYHLQTLSLATMAGDPASALAVDIDGNVRPMPAGTASDAGCYEEQVNDGSNPLQFLINAATAGDTITLTDTDFYPGTAGVVVNKNLTIVSVPAGATVNDSITIATGANVTLSGLVVDPDRADNGIMLDPNSIATVSNCVIKNAKLAGNLYNGMPLDAGCGINVGGNSELTVVDCTLSDNNYNGISSVGGKKIDVSGTVFAGGTYGTNGLGGWADDWANGREYSAYIALEDANDVDIVNCLMTGPCTSGIRIAGAADAKIDHNTIIHVQGAGVNANGSDCIGINPVAATKVRITNNILSGFATFYRAAAASTGTITGGYNFGYQKSWVNAYNISEFSTDTFGVDPMFVGGGDYHLSLGSPAAMAGQPASTLAVDLEGNARPMPAGTVNDPGCYEDQVNDGSNLLQLLINAANDGDTLTITDSGVYAGASGVLIDKSLVIESVPAGASIIDELVIDANSLYAPITVTISGFDITGNGTGNTIEIADDSTVTISDCHVKSTAGLDYDGGQDTGYAIVADDAATLTVVDCEIEIVGDGDTGAVEAMGGIYAGDGVALVSHRNMFYGQDQCWGDSDNTANRYKGNICLTDNASADIANCLLFDGDGSSIRLNDNANAVIEHCTIVDSNGRVSALRLANSAGDTINLTFKNNIVAGGWWIGVFGRGALGSVNYTDDNNLFNQTRNQGYYAEHASLVGGANNLYSGVVGYAGFMKPAASVQVNENIAVNDYHLSAVSPAINAGAASSVAGDFDGLGRPMPAATNGDIGCYEHQTNDLTGDMDYQFEDGSGTVAANGSAYGAALNATLVNMDDSDWVASFDGSGALDFDGIDDYVSIPGPGVTTANITVSGWVRRVGAQVDWAGLIYDRDDGAFGLVLRGNSLELGYTWPGNSSWEFDSNMLIEDGVWTFVALSVEPDKGTLYKYAPGDPQVLKAVYTAPHAAVTLTNGFNLGIDTCCGGRPFKGQMDDIRIFNRSLIATELESLVALPRQVVGTSYTAKYVWPGQLTAGFPTDWSELKSDTLHQVMEGDAAAAGKDREQDIDFAWNEQFLFVRIAETVVDVNEVEGTVTEWEADPYTYDGVAFYNDYETSGLVVGMSSDGQERVVAPKGGMYATQNSVDAGKRVVVLATEWVNIIPDAGPVAVGYDFVCNPLILDSDGENWVAGEFVWGAIQHQSFIGGEPHSVADQYITNVRLGLWGDINGDKYVNIADLADLAEEWTSTLCGECNGADIAPVDAFDGEVNIDDLIQLANDWLE